MTGSKGLFLIRLDLPMYAVLQKWYSIFV